MNRKIKLLIVDDSAFMRMAVRKMLANCDEVEIVGEANHGRAALDLARRVLPDVVTMDVEMPEMDGIAATRALLAERQVAIIMLSSVTQKGAQTTLDALAAGAVDFVSKSSSFVQLDISQIEKDLRDKITYWGRQAITAPARRAGIAKAGSAAEADRRRLRDCDTPRALEIVVVGVSTGGPKQVPLFLQGCGALDVPIVIAQHMPQHYTASFAQHLAASSKLNVVEGHDGQSLKPGQVVILPGGFDGALMRGIDGSPSLKVRQTPDIPIHPSVDILFESCARNFTSAAAIILTGMGADGTRGARSFAQQALPVLVQTPEECVVGGMPQAAIEAGVVSHVMSAASLGMWLRTRVKRLSLSN